MSSGEDMNTRAADTSGRAQARPVYVVDCSSMHDRSSVHEELVASLPLPSYYGCNLDALWDALWEFGPCEIVLVNSASLDSLDSKLGEYGEAVLATFADAQEEIPGISLRLIERY